MKIVKFTAENVKKLRAVEITPTGELVKITGRNGQGKSSILDAIWWALAGAKHIQAVPIRKGQKKARIRLDLGEITVERRFTETSSTLVVEKADGARYTSPQSILDALLGALTFDPLAFVKDEAKEQFETLRGIVKLDVDLDKLDGLNLRDFERRTEINRETKQKRAQADGITVAADLPAERVDTAAILDRMTQASKVNGEIEQRKARRDKAAADILDLSRRAGEALMEASRLRTEAERKDAEAARLQAQAAELREKLEAATPLPDPVDVDVLRQELEAAETTNKRIDRRARKAAVLAEAETLEGQARALTETITARTKTKADAIAAAAMPIPGLGFGDGLVTFNGLPFSQASDAEQLRVSVAIAMAANPKLRVLRIKEGSLLDEQSLELLAQLAREHDYQIWIERVDSSGKVGVVIEDGAVVAVDGEAVLAEEK